MAEGHGGGGVKNDLWLFLGIMGFLFLLWVMGGGPQNAEKNPPSPIINGPLNGGAHGTTNDPYINNSSQTSGEIEVQPLP